MRKFLIAFFIFGYIFNAYCQKTNIYYGPYGIKKSYSLKEYRKYVGDTVLYMINNGVFNNDKTLRFSDLKHKISNIDDNEYVIKKAYFYANRVSFLLKQVNGNKKVKISAYPYKMKNKYVISDTSTLPLFLIKKFKNDASKYIGRIYSHEKLKHKFECVDILLQPLGNMFYVLKNTTTGEKVITTIHDGIPTCFNKYLEGHYISPLYFVEKPANEKIRYGETKIIVGDSITKYSYIDNFVDITIACEGIGFVFNIKNTSDNTIKIIWDEASFVHFDGSSFKVIHGGIDASKLDAIQPPSVIIKNASMEDYAIPICNMQKNGKAKSMFTVLDKVNEGFLRLMLPIQIKDVINEYVFVFRVKWEYDYPEMINNM